MVSKLANSEQKKAAIIDYKGSWNVGAYALATDKFAIFGDGFRPKIIREAREVLRVPIIIQNIMDEPIVGILAAANSNGILVPPQITNEEKKSLEEQTGVVVEPLSFKTYENALGNILLVNDKVVLIHSDLAKRNKVILKKIEDVLDVEVIDYNFSFPIMGTVAVANNRGVLTHPSLKDEELEFIKNTLGLRVGKGTVNMGSPYVRSGLIVNSHGFLAGLKTSGLEMQRIYEILIS